MRPFFWMDGAAAGLPEIRDPIIAESGGGGSAGNQTDMPRAGPKLGG